MQKNSIFHEENNDKDGSCGYGGQQLPWRAQRVAVVARTWTQVPSLFVGFFVNNGFFVTNSSMAFFTVS